MIKQKIAVAIENDRNTKDPIIGVKGESLMAELIIKTAKRYNVPVIKDPKLADILNQIPSDQPIPTELIPALEIVIGELG